MKLGCLSTKIIIDRQGTFMTKLPYKHSYIKHKYCEFFRQTVTPLVVTVRHAQFRQARHSCVLCRSVLDYTVDIGELSERHRVSVVLTGLTITQEVAGRHPQSRRLDTSQYILLLPFILTVPRHVHKDLPFYYHNTYTHINPTGEIKHKYQFHYEQNTQCQLEQVQK